jgi:uncharacterized repeat protein (TIGR01451 family)
MMPDQNERYAMRRHRLAVSILLTVVMLGAPAMAAAQFGGPNPVLTKTMEPKRPKVGQLAWIKIMASNQGNANADNVVITDPIPDNMALVGVSTTQGNISISHGIVTIYVGTLTPGQTITVTNDVVITREFANDTPFTNCTGLTYRDGTARLACFPLGPSADPVSITSPPRFLPEAGFAEAHAPLGVMVAGVACLLIARRLRSRR